MTDKELEEVRQNEDYRKAEAEDFKNVGEGLGQMG
jgi:hypothetical protein